MPCVRDNISTRLLVHNQLFQRDHEYAKWKLCPRMLLFKLNFGKNWWRAKLIHEFCNQVLCSIYSLFQTQGDPYHSILLSVSQQTKCFILTSSTLSIHVIIHIIARKKFHNSHSALVMSETRFYITETRPMKITHFSFATTLLFIIVHAPWKHKLLKPSTDLMNTLSAFVICCILTIWL